MGGRIQLEGFNLMSTTSGANRCGCVLVNVSEEVSASVNEVELGGVYGLSLGFVYQRKQYNLLGVYIDRMILIWTIY